MEELKLKCEALRANWIHEETFRLKNKASVADIFEQMTRMKTTKTPAHTSIEILESVTPIWYSRTAFFPVKKL
jgi:hypothetical protein